MFLFGNSRKKQEAQIMAPQCLKIIKDCANLVNSTVNPDVFFSRYDLMIDKLFKLSQMERYVKLSGIRPSEQLAIVQSQRGKETEYFIKRSFERITKEANQLKTAKSKISKVDKYFEKMQSYKRYLSTDNQNLLKSLVDTYRDTHLL